MAKNNLEINRFSNYFQSIVILVSRLIKLRRDLCINIDQQIKYIILPFRCIRVIMLEQVTKVI